jgi:Ca2+-binding RTX toxin-like protein
MATFVYDGSRLNLIDMPVGGPFDIFEAFSMNVLGTLGNDNFDVTGILQYIGNNTFILESGNDTLRGSDQGEAIYGGNGNDDLAGNGGNDWIGGGDGDDTVSAGSGNDTLISSNGNDLYFGGAGDDVFSYDGNSFKTLILDAAASIEILDAFSMSVLGTLGDDLFDVTGILQYVKSNTGHFAVYPLSHRSQGADPARRGPLPPTPQDREHVRSVEGLAAHRHPL